MLLQDRLEVESGRWPGVRRRCGRRARVAAGLSHWDRCGRGPVRTRPGARPARGSPVTTPANSDSISFMIFIASMMQRICPFETRVPDRDVRLGARLRRAVEGPDHRRLHLEQLRLRRLRLGPRRRPRPPAGLRRRVRRAGSAGRRIIGGMRHRRRHLHRRRAAAGVFEMRIFIPLSDEISIESTVDSSSISMSFFT